MRVAAIPSRAGMRTSISTTSGRSAGSSSTACRPSAQLGDDLEAVGRREDSREAGADDRLVVDEGGSDHRLPRSSSGSSQRTRQPSRVGPAVSSPPSAVARSCIPISP